MFRLTQPNEIEPYLKDASQFSGTAEGVVLPENEKEVAEFLKEANAKKIPVTILGGKTGLAGAAVPQGGWALSTEKLSRILQVEKRSKDKSSSVRLEPAILLKDLDRVLEKESLFYAPDPTGPKAFIGGTLATDASGPNSFKYGATRKYVQRIRVVLADGSMLDLRRGQILADRNGILEIPKGTQKLRVLLPHYSFPKVKHAGGYYSKAGMDAIDLFVGSEGTLGVITEIELNLLPRPAEILAFIVFFRSEENAWKFSGSARELSLKNRTEGDESEIEARVLEYFDGGAIDFLRPDFPSIPKEARALIFIEQETLPEDIRSHSERWYEFFQTAGALTEIWQAGTAERQREFRDFRSKLPLAVKDFLAEHRQVKIGTDTCVPHECFGELMLFHRRRVEEKGLRSVTFGHVGESHVHLNILPRNQEEAEKGRALYPEFVEKALALGGTFSAEHGVGKLKRPYLARLFGEKAIEEMKAVKRVFDPNGILGRGNLFEIQ